MHEAAGVTTMRGAGRVYEQAQQALGLRPALHRVLLVHVTRVFGEAPQPCLRLVAAADPPLGERLKHRLGALAPFLARPAADDLDCFVEALRVAAGRNLCERTLPKLRVAVPPHALEEKTAPELACRVVVKSRLRGPPAVGRHAGARERRPRVLLLGWPVLHRDSPEL